MKSDQTNLTLPFAPEFDWTLFPKLEAVYDQYPLSFQSVLECGCELDLPPHQLAVVLETLHRRKRYETDETFEDVWQRYTVVWEVMVSAINGGKAGNDRLKVLSGDWAKRLAGRASILGHGWQAFTAAMATQEYNAGMGPVAAAPTGGASGTVPGAIWAAANAVGASKQRQVEALCVAGLIGVVAFRRGPVSGAQSGCGGEIGVAATMAAGAVCHLLGGSWRQIEAAGALTGVNFVGTECSPALGRVEFPCIPRNAGAALISIAFAESAIEGLVPPYGLDAVLDRIFTVGGLLPENMRETECGDWMEGALKKAG